MSLRLLEDQLRRCYRSLRGELAGWRGPRGELAGWRGPRRELPA